MMADQNYPTLYEEMEQAAQRTRGAAISFEGILGGAENAMVPVNNYPAQPTIAGRVKQRIDSLVIPIEAAARAAARWVGYGTVQPTVRMDGTPLQPGDEWQNTANNLRYSWSGTSWVPLNANVQELGQVLGAQIAALADDLAIAKAKDVYLESFRMNNGVARSDSDTIIAALAWIGTNIANGLGSRLIFESSRTYIYDRTAEIGNINDLVIDLNGATLKRASASLTTGTLTTAVAVGGTSIVVNAVPASWRAGDYLTAFTNNTDTNTSRNPVRIQAINQGTRTITLQGGFGAFGPNTVNIPAGARIGKSYYCILGRPSTEENGNLRPGINSNVHIVNGSIDGDSANQLNNSWRFSTEIYLNGRSSGISGVRFSNTAGECIVGHGLRVEGCEFRNMSGSCFHLSRHDDTEPQGSASWFTTNVVDGVCLAGNAVNGHSEGAVTFSWGAGRLMVTSNEFRNGNEGVLGGFGPSSGIPMADKWITVSGNICMTFNRIFQALVAPLEGVLINDNIFIDCNDNQTELSGLLTSKSCSVGGNVAIGNTVLSGGFRATNVTAGDDMSGTLTQVKLWARGAKMRANYTSMTDLTAIIEGSTALLGLLSGDTTGSGLAFHSTSGKPVGSFFLQWLPALKKLQLLGNEDGAKVEFTTPVNMQSNRLNIVLPIFATDAAAKAAGLVKDDMYKAPSGAVFTVSS